MLPHIPSTWPPEKIWFTFLYSADGLLYWDNNSPTLLPGQVLHENTLPHHNSLSNLYHLPPPHTRGHVNPVNAARLSPCRRYIISPNMAHLRLWS